jgi:hypothetical protein
LLEGIQYIESLLLERRDIAANLQQNTPHYVLRLANINAPARKQENCWLKLIANKITLRLTLFANRLIIICNGLAIIRQGSH